MQYSFAVKITCRKMVAPSPYKALSMYVGMHRRHYAVFHFFFSLSLSSALLIFPLTVLGSDRTNSTLRGYL